MCISATRATDMPTASMSRAQVQTRQKTVSNWRLTDSVMARPARTLWARRSKLCREMVCSRSLCSNTGRSFWVISSNFCWRCNPADNDSIRLRNSPCRRVLLINKCGLSGKNFHSFDRRLIRAQPIGWVIEADQVQRSALPNFPEGIRSARARYSHELGVFSADARNIQCDHVQVRRDHRSLIDLE
jgi:hypothetical protein